MPNSLAQFLPLQSLPWGACLKWLMHGCGSLLAATAFLPLLPVSWWWIRIGDFPRLQLLFAYLIGIGLLVPLLFFQTRAAACWIGVLGVACVIQLYWIYSYLPFAPVEVEQARSEDADRRIRIMVGNVLQDNQQVEKLLEQVEQIQPDVLVLVEVNQRWIDDLVSLEEKFAYHLTHPQENTYGIALYSQLEVESAEIRFLVHDDIPSIDATLQMKNGQSLHLMAVHPNPPRPGEDSTKRDGELVLAGREVAKRGGTAVVLGDLNDVGWSRTTDLFQEVSGLLDPRIGRGMYPTYNAKSKIWRYPLDYLFHSDDFRLVKLQTLSDIGSDHFPLLVELSFEPSAEHSQHAPELDQEDRDDAQEAVEKARKAAAEEPHVKGE